MRKYAYPCIHMPKICIFMHIFNSMFLFYIGVRGFLERDISSLRTVAGEGPTQKNSSRRVAAVVAPWKGYLGSMHKIIRKIHKTDIVS